MWTVRQLAIMAVLDGLPPKKGRWGVCTLANLLHIDKAVVSKACRSLASGGYLTREPNKSDRRLVLIELTPTGKAVMAELRRELVR